MNATAPRTPERSSPASAGATALVVVTPEQLQELVRIAVQEALAEQRAEAAPVLLDRNGIARALGVGTSTVDRLRREGLPSLMIGDSPRFVVAKCIEWLNANKGAK